MLGITGATNLNNIILKISMLSLKKLCILISDLDDSCLFEIQKSISKIITLCVFDVTENGDISSSGLCALTVLSLTELKVPECDLDNECVKIIQTCSFVVWELYVIFSQFGYVLRTA